MNIKKNDKITMTREYCNPNTGLVRWGLGDKPSICYETYIVENVVNNDVFLKDENGKVIKRAKSFFKPLKQRTYYVGDILTTVKTYVCKY